MQRREQLLHALQFHRPSENLLRIYIGCIHSDCLGLYKSYFEARETQYVDRLYVPCFCFEDISSLNRSSAKPARLMELERLIRSNMEYQGGNDLLYYLKLWFDACRDMHYTLESLQMEALNASLKDQQDENARLRELLEKRETDKVTVDTVVERLSTVPVSVFFNIGSSKVASRKDLVNVKEVAEYAKQTGRKVIVTGYADSRTGSVDFNQKLSQKRAEVVAEELVKMGVSRDQMEIKAKGGVDDIAPFSYNRRVTVMIND